MSISSTLDINNIDNTEDGLTKMLCFEFDKEMIEYLPTVMTDLFDTMIKQDHIEPDIKTFEYLLSIVSYYGNSSLCLYYFKQLSNTYNLRPSINIFNNMISCYCNEISLFSNDEQNINDALYLEKQLDLIETNIERIFAIYDNCKQLLVAPNIDTMKLLFHTMSARLLLSQNMEHKQQEYTMEYNQHLLTMLLNDDIPNYDITIDTELAYYILHCYISIGYWQNQELQHAVEIYDKFYLEQNIISHWTEDKKINLTNIPKNIYDEDWQFYIQYIVEYEQHKLDDLDVVNILIPSFEIGQKEKIEQEIQALMCIDKTIIINSC